MQFRIYVKRGESIMRFCTVTQTKKGLYVATARLRGDRDDHFSYHADGVCFLWLGGRRAAKAQRQQLDAFSGVETIILVNSVVTGVMPGQAVAADRIGETDILVERPMRFGMELMLANPIPDLPARVDRPNSMVWVRRDIAPTMLVEVWDIGSDGAAARRYPSSAPWMWREDLAFPGEQIWVG